MLFRCLAAEGGKTDIVQLSAACARELYNSSVTALPPETRRRLYRACREAAIDGLAEQDIVKYSEAERTVRLRAVVGER